MFYMIHCLPLSVWELQTKQWCPIESIVESIKIILIDFISLNDVQIVCREWFYFKAKWLTVFWMLIPSQGKIYYICKECQIT